ncbi:unnamed protein product [Chrysodeixis includens]|uniref:GPR180-like N-terminal domain-containing protein n=1 Tax=Chrysodeixis includens TaxID=689277 RepID=A0A9N8KX69_CHRIL|nr:unnamed protein product [Chrysodeixis includens]
MTRTWAYQTCCYIHDDDSQWPSVYHSSKTCKEREEVLNRAGQNQIIRLSHWYPDTEYSGCVITKHNKEIPASKSSTTPKPTDPSKTKKNTTKVQPPEPSYYDQFLKTTQNPKPTPTLTDSNTTWYELVPTDDLNTTAVPEDELWESIGPRDNGSHFGNLNDEVEILFDNRSKSGHKIKRSLDLYDRYRRRRLNAQPSGAGSPPEKEHLTVTCHNSRRFRSARERWWFIAISNCDNNKGLDVRYKFLMTNGMDGDFWHEHFSADEFMSSPSS